MVHYPLPRSIRRQRDRGDLITVLTKISAYENSDGVVADLITDTWVLSACDKLIRRLSQVELL
jgi:RPA family protein